MRIGALLVAIFSAVSHADEPELPAPKPPYSLPWQLRPLAPVRVVRLDDSLDLSNNGQADVLLASGAWSFHPRMYALARAGVVFNGPFRGASGNSVTNLLLGASYLHPAIGDVRLGAFLGVTAPIASGGGNTPDPGAKNANAAAILARSAMDNAMFAANDLALIPGLSAAYVKGGFTVQLELTVLELLRVRGETAQADASKTNFTSGLHVGYFVSPQFSVGGELRLQRWLSTPAAVAKDETLRQTVSAALGARLHLKAGALTLRPGVSYSLGLVGPMVAGGHNVGQFDLPVAFP